MRGVRLCFAARQRPGSSTIRVPLGAAVNVTCGPPTAFYCRMSGPSGETSAHAGQCRVHIKSVGSHHLDTWTCWSATTESAAEVQYTVRLHAYRGERRRNIFFIYLISAKKLTTVTR
jgi:hypothetical protein